MGWEPNPSDCKVTSKWSWCTLWWWCSHVVSAPELFYVQSKMLTVIHIKSHCDSGLVEMVIEMTVVYGYMTWGCHTLKTKWAWCQLCRHWWKCGCHSPKTELWCHSNPCDCKIISMWSRYILWCYCISTDIVPELFYVQSRILTVIHIKSCCDSGLVETAMGMTVVYGYMA